MTISFTLDGLQFLVSGVRHGDNLDLHSIHVQGNPANIRKLLDGPALESIEEAAAEALVEAGEEIPFDVPLLPALSDKEAEALR